MRYEIKGEPLPVVVCKLEEGEKMIRWDLYSDMNVS